MRRFVAAGFGVGLLPARLWGRDDGAGTLGALVAAGIAAALLPLPVWVHAGAVLVAVILSLWAPLPYLDQDPDPGWVAIDEVAGALLAVTALSGPGWLVAWIVARLADIFKVLPGVRAAEALPGTVGITADDLVAGLYGLGAGLLTMWVL